MPYLSQKISKQSRKKILASFLFIAILAPVPTFSSNKNKIFVSKEASSNQDGSSKHPYKTIEKAMEEADKDTEIHVSNGVYHENVKIKKGVELYGSDRDDTIIEADDDKPAVEMKDNTKLARFTIKEGKDGVRVNSDARVYISDCRIKENASDGVHVEEGSVRESKKVQIVDSKIHDNNRSGIFSEKRRIIIENDEIYDNDSDGVDIASRSDAWISESQMAGNGGSGMRLAIDGSNIWTKNNDVRRNNHDGIEVSFWGGSGRVNIEKSKIVNNDHYGVSKIQRAGTFSSQETWDKYLTFGVKNEFWGNKIGSISSILNIR